MAKGRSRGYWRLAFAAALGAILLFPAIADTRPHGQAAAAPSDAQTLSRVLALASDYCGRLSTASIDFVCLEEVSETIYDPVPHDPVSPHGRPSWRENVASHTYLYDYQFVVENGVKTEKRRILKLDGIKKKAEETDLDTLTFIYKNVLFGAVDLLAGSRQAFYHYEVKGRESLDGRPALVVDAAPLPGIPAIANRGTVWLREEDGAVLKVVWDKASMDESAAIALTAKRYKGTPRILQVTEFGLEKNGVRFPTRFRIEEAYITKKKKWIRSVLDAVYRNYKFFTVDVETRTIKGPA